MIRLEIETRVEIKNQVETWKIRKIELHYKLLLLLKKDTLALLPTLLLAREKFIKSFNQNENLELCLVGSE